MIEAATGGVLVPDRESIMAREHIFKRCLDFILC